jgi:hypothetical protein
MHLISKDSIRIVGKYWAEKRTNLAKEKLNSNKRTTGPVNMQGPNPTSPTSAIFLFFGI